MPSQMRSAATRALAALLCVALAWTPWALVWGDALSEVGREGQAVGQAAAEAFVLPGFQGDTLFLEGLLEGGSLSTEALFPGASAASAEDFSALYGQEYGLGAQGRAAQSSLLEGDAGQAAAFQSLYGAVGASGTDLTHDPVWSLTDAVIADMATLADSFADCEVTTDFQTDTRPVHLPAIETCQEVQQGGQCVMYHSYDLPPADHIVTATGGAVVTNCGRGCLEVRFDFPGAAHVGACPSCAYLPGQSFGFVVNDSERIERIQVSVHPSATEFDTGCTWDCKVDQLYQAWSIAFPGYSYADSSTGNFDGVNRPIVTHLDTTALMRSGAQFTAANDYKFETDSGNWYVAQAPYSVSVRIDFEPLPLNDHGWEASEACINLAASVRDNALCDGGTTCLGVPALNANGCYEDVGVLICPGDFADSPVPWLSPFCREIQVVADCGGFNSGPMDCWTDPQGQQRCPYNPGDIANDCGPLEVDPSCGYLGGACVEGARDANGFCYVTEHRYDCGTSTVVPDFIRDSDMDCAGPVRCVGNDCLDLGVEQSDDFAEAAAALQAAQFVVSDANCIDVNQCQVFAGEAAECKQAVGGIVDCCETPDGISLTDYIQLILAVSKIDSAIMALDAGSTLRGGWELLRDPLVDSWEVVTDAFTSAANTLMGNTAAAASEAAAELSLDAAKQALMRQTAQWTANVFGDAAANALFAVEGGGQAVVNGTLQAGNIQLGGLIGTTLAWAMTAYMIYSVAMILIQIIWTCEEEEFELGAKRALRSCHYVGSYCDSEVLGICIQKQKAFCCYNSPLARIINEQAYPQLGRSWGEAEQPDCRGLSLQELERLDWSQIDLSEWIALLTQAGQFPSPEDLDIDSLTGTGSTLNTGERADAAERTEARTDGLDANAVAREAEEAVWEAVLQGLP
ncbi:conjugal transfer mating pair stabilization protein TraN [Thiohalocapsa marina]|uniref:conjugal transfer mating pair stabilization protein TraN n=1 Tax=Thiohalocapsa marina TaxID=424902 RepID=UPI0036DEBBE9